MRLAIVSDTHMPKGPRRLPRSCVERLRAADLILHAGDLSTVAVLEELKGYGPVVAVHGNVDDRAVRAELPGETTLEIDDVRIAIVHDAGPRPGRIGRLRRRFPEADAVVFGHSHLPLHEADDGGFQIFNPGSPTERRRAPAHTMGLARLSGGELSFELVAVG